MFDVILPGTRTIQKLLDVICEVNSPNCRQFVLKALGCGKNIWQLIQDPNGELVVFKPL
jgi:hypothetical protein